MDRDAFEQLVNEWLDEPTRDDLRAAIEAAIAGAPELVVLRDRLVRMNDLIRAATALPRVGFDRFAARVSSAIDSSLDEQDARNGLAAALTQLPFADRRVDWARFHERVSAAIAAAERPPRIIRFPFRRRIAATVLAVAAAVAVFLFWPRSISTHEQPAGLAIARVLHEVSRPASTGSARVSISAPDGESAAAIEQVPALAAAEIFLMIDPPVRGARRESLN